jgi:hypothetical protein
MPERPTFELGGVEVMVPELSHEGVARLACNALTYLKMVQVMRGKGETPETTSHKRLQANIYEANIYEDTARNIGAFLDTCVPLMEPDPTSDGNMRKAASWNDVLELIVAFPNAEVPEYFQPFMQKITQVE